MRLVTFSIQNYRRFFDKSSVKLQGKLIAFVGPNEAGKSSILEAIALLNQGAAVSESAIPRRTGLIPEVCWILEIEDEDRKVLNAIPEAASISGVRITKRFRQQDGWSFLPSNPRRTHRFVLPVATELKECRYFPELSVASANEENPFSLDSYDHLLGRLESGTEDYSSAEINDLSTLAAQLMTMKVADGLDPESDEAGAAQKRVQKLEILGNAVRDLALDENEPSPWKRCVDAMSPRLPSVRPFTGEDRDLHSSYDLTEYAASPPAALRNLALLAGLDLVALREEAAAGRTADIGTRRNAANAQLSEKFSKSWNQEKVALQIELSGTVLDVNVSTPADDGLSTLEERSDGLRWFAALVAFANALEARPIITVDEIETHLHYDAQADLIDVLAAQEFASKVIYTTHSFGCLPHDLGTGVRVVEQIGVGRSKLENGYWHKGAGFQPLLASMGAAAVSFTPTRRALITEGPADAILYPSLFREALSANKLDFQVAPGLSIVAKAGLAELDHEAGRVGYLVDGDPGGLQLKSDLIAAGVPADRIFDLTHGAEALEVEDLIDTRLYVDCVNQELDLWGSGGSFAEVDVAPTMRTKALVAWCAANGKEPPTSVPLHKEWWTATRPFYLQLDENSRSTFQKGFCFSWE